MFEETVERKDGFKKRVVAGSKEDLAEAVKVAKNEEAPVYPNINVPVAKGHDLVGVDDDVNKVLLDGTGAHNSPNNAVEPFNPETDSDVPVPGADEPAYKTVPVGDNDREQVETPNKAEVAAAQAEAKKSK